MSSAAGPLYELIFQAEPGTDAGLQPWLSELREQLLQHDSVTEARVFESGSNTNAVTTWTLQLPCRTEDALAEMQASIFANVDAALAEEFGDAASVSSRVLRQEVGEEIPGIENTDCLNCGAPLQGQYCGICGQRARNRLISLWELISDAFGDLLEIDSRLWRTLIPLFMRPGQLTRDYLEGRRARYMPPFRTYLVLSVIFFVVAFFDPRDDLSLLFEPQPEPTPEQQAEEAAQVAAAKKEILDELAAEGIIVGNTVIKGEQQADQKTSESTEN
ncbi:MAG: DUF3667 domain-containing protein, partial [Woeseiaceae bacterium]